MAEPAASASIRVLVVDDDLMVRQTLADYLATASDLDLIGSCADGVEAVDAVTRQAPDVVLMDIRMPVMDGIDATREILRIAPQVRVLALTTFDADEAIAAIFDCGGAGFLLKNTRPAALVEAIRAAHNGLAVIPPNLISRWTPSRIAVDRPSLAPREQEVLSAVSQGLTNREIAARLFISASTVKIHIAALMRKLEADNRTALAARAHELGLL